MCSSRRIKTARVESESRSGNEGQEALALGWGLCLLSSDPSPECPGMSAHTPNSSTHVLPNTLSALEGPWGQEWLHHSQISVQNENTVKDIKYKAFSFPLWPCSLDLL